MKQFTLDIEKKYQRPVLRLNNWNNFFALLDTGAIFPIWTANENILRKLGGKCIREHVSFGGFGGETIGNLYVLPQMIIGDLIFPNIHIIACNDLGNTPYQLIISATMFQGLIYEIDTVNHKLNIIIPDDNIVRNLRIIDSSGRLHILVGNEFKCSEETADIAAAFKDYTDNR